MSKKIGIIGHFGGKHNFLDGQTVKTKIFCEELKKRVFSDVMCVDTYLNKTNKISLLIKSLRCLMSCDIIVVILSKNGLKTYLPLLYATKKMRKCKIYHNVIGGSLAEYTGENKNYVKYLNSLDANWVETSRMAKELEELGVVNCDVVPNFKNINSKKALEQPTENGINKFCTFSRIRPEKGIEKAIESVAAYNETHSKKAKLEIWGAVSSGYEDGFERLLREHSECVTYMGGADYNASVEAITDSLALLFPTYWKSEGFPGTIVDAYAAAVPVIASDWNSNSEIVRDFETGWVYPNERVKTLEESIEYAMEHQDEMISMRKNCALLATRYTADFVMRRIIEKYFKD